MPNTTNFNWATPADTDLVKDGAAAIRTLGSSIDTSFVDLKGGTTGQILSKASNTDLDFTWTAGGDITEVQAGTGISVASGTGPIPVVTNTIATTFDAKADLVVGTGADTFAKLTVGANDTVLTADSTTATGLKWAAPATGGANWTLKNAGGTTLTGAQTVTITGISNVSQIFVIVDSASSANASAYIGVQLNGDTATNYNIWGTNINPGSTYAAGDFRNLLFTGEPALYFGRMSGNAGSTIAGYCYITGCSTSGLKMAQIVGGASVAGSNGQANHIGGGYYNSASAITSVSIYSNTGNLDGGTVYVYTSA